MTTPAAPLRPTSTNPPRAAGSWRRTSSVDILRPDGPGGTLVLRGRGRDLVTDVDGRPETRDHTELSVEIDYVGGATVLAVTSDRHGQELDGALRGRSALSGFRGALEPLIGEVLPDGGLDALLLDEVSVATVISRAALSDRELVWAGPANPPQLTDVCSGWRAGGLLSISVASTGQLPDIPRPQAPDLHDDPLDDLAWHDMQHPLPHGSMRRVRRIDLKMSTPGSAIVDSLFRDSLVHPRHGHVVVHEYAVSATISTDTGIVESIHSEPHVLPAGECPAATASGALVVGRPVATMRRELRRDLQGIGTCTHLNDHFRALGDVHRALAAVPFVLPNDG